MPLLSCIAFAITTKGVCLHLLVPLFHSGVGVVLLANHMYYGINKWVYFWEKNILCNNFIHKTGSWAYFQGSAYFQEIKVYLRGDSHPDIKPYLDISLQHPHSKSNSWQRSCVGSQWGYFHCQYSQHCPGGLDQHHYRSEHCWRQLHLLIKNKTACILVTAIFKLWIYSLLTECSILDHCISIAVGRSKDILYHKLWLCATL